MSGAEPRFATARNLNRETRAHEALNIMKVLGWEPMPWQKQVCEVAYEVDESGDYVYEDVVVIVPRQAGKTSLLLSGQVHRALMLGRPQRSVYTAQTGSEARTKFLEEHVPLLESSPFAPYFSVARGAADTHIRWENDSFHSIAAPNRKAGHGKTLDLVQLDEAFGLQNDDLEQGTKPTTVTRKGAQFWIVSAAGDIKSTYLKAKIELGREFCRQNQQNTMAYFEWSAEDEWDSTDPETWKRVHPALGFTIDIEKLRSHFQTMKLVEFERAYLAKWPDEIRESVIPHEKWKALEIEAQEPSGSVWFGLEVSKDRSRASVSAAWKHSEGPTEVRVLRTEDGTGWVAGFLVALLGKRPGSRVALNVDGAAASLIPDLIEAGIQPYAPVKYEDGQLYQVTNSRWKRACGAFYDAATHGKLAHTNQKDLNVALSCATRKYLSGTWVWDCKLPGVDITPLTSATLAYWGTVDGPKPIDYEAFYELLPGYSSD